VQRIARLGRWSIDNSSISFPNVGTSTDIAESASTPKNDSSSGDRITVCQVLHSLNVGGAEVLAARISRDLSDRFRFVFACLDDLGTLGEELRRDGFAVEVLNRRAGFDRRCARRLAAWFRREQVAAVHAHQYTPFFYCLASGMLRRRPPVLFTEHGRWFPDYPRRKRMMFNRFFLKRKDRVVAVGEHVRQALINNEGIPANRVEVVYNGVDVERFGANGHLREEVRRELGLAEDDFAVLHVARLDALKDHRTAVKALAKALKHAPNCILLLAGEGPEQAAIREEVASCGVGERVRMLGLRRDVPRLLAAADVFLLSSISEGIPVTLIEAMAARLPIVSTRVGGCGEVVIDGETGRLTESGDAAGLAAALVDLSRSRETRQAMGNAGRNRAEAMFTQSQMTASYAAMYVELAHVGR
jgi:glycosyltransferase involved in cell wall biosynthesis